MVTRLLFVFCVIAIGACEKSSAEKFEEAMQREVSPRPWLEIPLAASNKFMPPALTRESLHIDKLRIGLSDGISGSQETKVSQVNGATIEFLRIVDHHNYDVNYELFFASQITLEGLGQSAAVKKWCSDFKAFERKYKTDLDLVRAAHSAVPSDAKSAATEAQRQDLMTLLMVKDQLVNGPTEMRLPNMTVFYGTRQTGSGFVEMFDNAGNCRGGLIIRNVDKKQGPVNGATIVARLFYHASFENEEAGK